MNKSEIDKHAIELGKAILPLAGQAIITDGATGLEHELNLFVEHTQDPAIAKLADARRGNDVESKSLEEEVVRSLHQVVGQIDHTLQDIDRNAISGGVRLSKEKTDALRGLLVEKRDYFSRSVA